MIISFEHKFVFVAVPKTGTHAVRQALRGNLAPGDIEQVRFFVEKSLPIPELARIQHGHITLEELRPHLPPEQFAALFKFAFVRNPFDRFISYCSFVTRGRGGFLKSPQRVMAHFIQNPPWQHILFRPQYSFICSAEGDLLADYVGRVEDMQTSYDEICRRCGIPSSPLEKVNATRRADYRQYYDPALAAGVARLYARDLELFDYRF